MKIRLLVLFFTTIILGACSPKETKVINIDYTRFNNELRVFEDEDIQEGIEPDKILFLGSSSIRMWTTIAEDMEPFSVLNRGFGGATAIEVNYHFDKVVKPYSPKIMVVYVGENDIAEGFTANQAYEEVQKLFNKTKEISEKCKIIYLSMKPSIARWEMWPEMKKANAKIKKMIDSNEDFYYIETADVMLNKDGTPRTDIFIEDGLHMNEKGYDDWAKLIKPVLEGFFQ